MSIESVKGAIEARNAAVKAVRDIHEAAEGRELTGEEVAQERKFESDIVALDGEVQGGLAGLEREAKAVEARAKLEAFDNAAASEVVEDNAHEAEKRAFDAMVNGEARSFEARDLLAGTATDGAELVPTSMYNQIVEHMLVASPIMSLATVIRTTGGEQIDIPKTTSYSAAAIIAEAGSITESDPQFATVSLNAYKYGFMVQSSSELISDSAFDTAGFIARQGGSALGRGMDAHFVSGSGSSQPSGVDLAATGVTAASATVSAVDELIDLQHSVTAPYQANASWVVADATLSEIRQLKDGNGNYLWQPADGRTGAPGMLLGKPIFTDENVGVTATGVDSVVYGDFSTFYVRMAGPIRIERSDDHGFANDLVSWRFLARADSAIVDTNGIRVLTQL